MVDTLTSTDDVASPSRWRARSQWALYGLPVLVLLVVAIAHRWMVDDGFINLRVVRQIEAGHGPVFNAGQRVEAYSSPLWLAVLLVADVLTPFRLEYLAVGLGILGTVAGFGMALVGCVRLARSNDAPRLLLPFGVLVPVAVAPSTYESQLA
jgi:arabinofuranosyltransferase